MKKVLLIFILSLFSFNKSSAQLEVIDKVAEVLIPGITNGIKSVLESSNGNKVRKSEVQELKNELLTKSKSIVLVIDQDASNLTALNSLFKVSGGLFDDIASMKILTNPIFLDEVIKTQSHQMYAEIAKLFALHWRQLEDKKGELKKVTGDANDNSIKDDIAIYVALLDENLLNLTSVVGLVKSPKADMTFSESTTYVNNLKRSREYISEINNAIRNINIQLSSRIGSLNKSLKNGKKQIDQLISDAKE